MTLRTPTSADPARILFWLNTALIALPFLQALPFDFDRTAPLVLLLPALWTGRNELRAGMSDIALGCARVRVMLLVFASAVLIATCVSARPAVAAVTAATWVLVGAVAVIAGRIVRDHAAASRTLLAAVAVGAAAGAVLTWSLWLSTGRGGVPLYAHHRIFGLHMLTGAATATALLAASSDRFRRWLWFGVGAVTWGAMLWSGGRAPVLAAMGGLIVWLAIRRADRKPLVRATLLHAIAGLALSALFWTPNPALGWWHAFERTAAAASGGVVDVSALTSTRSEFWRSAANHALASPWIGHGPDAYRFITPKLDGQQPHNFALQLWLDVGVFGALAALALVARMLFTGCRKARNETNTPAAAWLALLVALLIAGSLDGVFYHQLTLLPAGLTLGVVLFVSMAPTPGPASERDQRSVPARRWLYIARTQVAASLVILTLHAFIFHVLAVLPPAEHARAASARIVRLFPSTTFGLWRWLDTWQRTDPDAAIAWAQWAQKHATNPTLFHMRAAQYLNARGDRAAALAELNFAEAKAHAFSRASIAELKQSMFPAP